MRSGNGSCRQLVDGIQIKPGIYMRLEDFCNSTEKGARLLYTASCVLVEEELMGIELGWRVANIVTEKAIDSWDALLDAQIKERGT